MNRLIGPLLILLCTVIWGSAFLAQKTAGGYFGPFAVTCYRNLLGGAFLSVYLLCKPGFTRAEVLGGAASGLVLFAAMAAQQIGLDPATPGVSEGVSAFLTANYVLLVPVFAWLVGKGRPSPGVWFSVALALVGAFFICLSSGEAVSGVGKGELWTLLCAALFAVQIMVVDRFARKVDIVRFSIVQLFAAGLFSAPFILLPSELARASWSGFTAGLPALLYIGFLSSGVAYTLQNLGQARTPPALAAIIMSMESVFSALFAWLLRDVTMPPRQILGCALVFAAVVLSQLIPARSRSAA